MFVLCGFIFPLTVTALGQVLFPEQANGSLVKQDGKVIGSKLIDNNGQNLNISMDVSVQSITI